MTSVHLALPPEVIEEAVIPYDGIRDASGVVLAIDGINFVASIVTLATLRTNATGLLRAIRNWRLKSDQGRPMTLTVKGDGLDLRIDLPPNVHVATLFEQLRPLLADGQPEAGS